MSDIIPSTPESSDSEKINSINRIISELFESFHLELSQLPTIVTLEQLPRVIKILLAAREESANDTQKINNAIQQIRAIVPADPFYRAEIDPQFIEPQIQGRKA